jgi:hypothetical protein
MRGWKRKLVELLSLQLWSLCGTSSALSLIPVLVPNHQVPAYLRVYACTTHQHLYRCVCTCSLFAILSGPTHSVLQSMLPLLPLVLHLCTFWDFVCLYIPGFALFNSCVFIHASVSLQASPIRLAPLAATLWSALSQRAYVILYMFSPSFLCLLFATQPAYIFLCVLSSCFLCVLLCHTSLFPAWYQTAEYSAACCRNTQVLRGECKRMSVGTVLPQLAL